MQKEIRRTEYTELAALFWLQFMGLGVWFVPLSAVLDAHGLNAIKPYAFAASGVAAFISPLIFGAMADRHASPAKVLRCLTAASAAAILLVAWSINAGWPSGIVLLLIQLYSLCMSPTTSITTAIVFSRLGNSRSEFGPVRAGATLGWVCGCWLVSALKADASTRALYVGAGVWLTLCAFTFFLPNVARAISTERMTLKQRLGWDALSLLKNPDHRVVFITAALYNIPLAAFYPYTPPHLRQLGFQRLSAWTTLGQSMEFVGLFLVGGIFLRVRLKWIFLAGLAFGVVRFGVCALNNWWSLLLGTTMQGFCYTLYYITAQIYLDERVQAAWRTRAQALFSLMTDGLGNLMGYLITGWWGAFCFGQAGMNWPLFWTGIAATSGVVMVYFLVRYHGIKGARPK